MSGLAAASLSCAANEFAHPGTRSATRGEGIEVVAGQEGALFPSGPGFVEIDGARNPELIPDHILWRQVFRYFSSNAKMPQDLKSTLENHFLPMPAADYAVLRRSADEHAESEAAFDEAALILQLAYMKTEGPSIREKLVGEMRVLDMKQRIRTLDIADAMLQALSESGPPLLLAWSRDFKSGISVTVLASDLEHFRRPRVP